jgi:hypothetical protein
MYVPYSLMEVKEEFRGKLKYQDEMGEEAWQDLS